MGGFGGQEGEDSNIWWAQLGGLSDWREMNELEEEFLKVIDWDLAVTEQERVGLKVRLCLSAAGSKEGDSPCPVEEGNGAVSETSKAPESRAKNTTKTQTHLRKNQIAGTKRNPSLHGMRKET